MSDSRFKAAKGWSDEDDNNSDNASQGSQVSEIIETEDNEGPESGEVSKEKGTRKRGSKKSFLVKDAKKFKDELDKRGVIYISRIPPFMKPNKARTLLEPYGEISRIYLAEEDASVRKKRKQSGGNSSRQFAEGWVEFTDKKVAKRVAESLNNTPMGGRKGDFYHDDTWNLKYLKKFKWEYLTEKVAYERRVREQKVKASMLQSKRENAEFVELVEQNKAHKHVEERKKKRKQQESGGDNEEGVKKVRSFRQDKLIGGRYGDIDHHKADSSVIGKIFSTKK